MDKIVAVLTQINEKAEKILSDANSCKLDIQKHLEADIKEYEEKLMAKTEEELKRAASENSRNFEEKKANIYKDTETQIKAMEENYNKNHDAMVNEIFDKIISFEM